MIKPDAMKNGHAGVILDRLIKEGYRIVALKLTQLSPEKAGTGRLLATRAWDMGVFIRKESSSRLL